MKAVIWVFGLLSLLYLAVWFSEDAIRNWFFPNHVTVEAYSDAKLKNVRIDWTAENLEDTLIIYEGGAQTDTEFRSKGFNYFLFYKDNELISIFDQFKQSKVAGHEYRFLYYQKQDSIVLDLKIQGADANH